MPTTTFATWAGQEVGVEVDALRVRPADKVEEGVSGVDVGESRILGLAGGRTGCG